MRISTQLFTMFLPMALVIAPTSASAGGCPAFNSSMIDAAFLAIDYSQQDPLVGAADDSPSDASVVCYLETDAEATFFVRVGICEGVCGAGEGKGEATVIGLSPDDMAPGADYSTQLRTRVFSLTWAEQQACRAQVLASFTWKQHCKALMD